MSVRLEQLLAAATPGGWKAEDGSGYLAGRGWWVEGPETLSHGGDVCQADAALIALAPDMARLLIEWARDDPALLARLDDLGKDTP